MAFGNEGAESGSQTLPNAPPFPSEEEVAIARWSETQGLQKEPLRSSCTPFISLAGQ